MKNIRNLSWLSMSAFTGLSGYSCHGDWISTSIHVRGYFTPGILWRKEHDLCIVFAVLIGCMSGGMDARC